MSREEGVSRSRIEAAQWRPHPLVEQFDPSAESSHKIAKVHLGIRRWQESIGQNEFTDILSSQVDLTEIEQYYIKPGGNFFVAKDPAERTIIGFVGLRNDGNNCASIKRLCVIPRYQRRGIATELTKTAVEWARCHGFKRIDLATHKQEKARMLYERQGFNVIGADESRGDWLMVLNLRRTGA